MARQASHPIVAPHRSLSTTMDAPTSLGKRKAPPSASSAGKNGGGSQLAFSLVPDVCWELISSFASPPDVYNLSLSSKHFFRPINAVAGSSADGDDAAVSLLALSKSTASADPVAAKKSALQAVINSALQNDGDIDIELYKIARDNGYSKPFILHNVLNALPKKSHEAAEAAAARGEAALPAGGGSTASGRSATTPTLLATSLLRQSLLSSLGRVLDQSTSGITLESVLAMPEGALIAGSTIAQACLGVVWESKSKYKSDRAFDVDIFCSAKAAPMVRSWLVEKANCMFGGFNDGYISIADSRLVYTVDTKIHHVEAWGSIYENVKDNDEGIGGYGHGKKKVGEGDDDAEVDIETLKNTKYYKDAVKWGKGTERYAVSAWKFSMQFDKLGVDLNKAYT